ncbi:iron uptake porin [Leptolyngbya sp. FACHB-261]|uniref:iron uptake porin n=1 Tax=Leptolyngbya sp. FACHB-261 TaxID=2692806 RepID=UPI0016834B19|nr:iron uptake porin [Leptolyngbya sp. FACHB-261]MBD2101844.1 carbohydrate porin [Leptolyngbya sp. FACHB-261]
MNTSVNTCIFALLSGALACFSIASKAGAEQVDWPQSTSFTSTLSGEVQPPSLIEGVGLPEGAAIQISSEVLGSDTPNSDARLFNVYSAEGDQIVPIDAEQAAQITSVSQLSDVDPTDWAFQALQSLTERYGVISGYPDGNFRGNRVISRYEFAAGLNATLAKVSALLATGSSNPVNRADLETLQKLQENFASELATLRGQIDSLEARNTELAANQFSTTTVLGGEAIFGLSVAGGGGPPGQGDSNTVLNYLSRLQFTTAFSNRDLLRIGLVAGNFSDDGFASPGSLNTNMALLSYQGDTSYRDIDDQAVGAKGSRVVLDAVEYRFSAFNDRIVFSIIPAGFSLSSILSPNSPYSDSGRGAISQFGEFSPIFKIGSLDAGLGFDWFINGKIRLQFAYGSRNSSDAADGLFSADHSALGIQFLLRPSRNLNIGLAYVNAFADDGRLDTYTGSFNADTSGGIGEPAKIHAFNGTLQWRLSPSFTLSAWGGLIITNSLESDAIMATTTYQFSLGFFDPFGREGDLLALLVGQPPKLVAGLAIERADEGSGIHYELFYRLQVNDNISITPGFFYVSDPGHIPDNNDIFVATIRTTFRF